MNTIKKLFAGLLALTTVLASAAACKTPELNPGGLQVGEKVDKSRIQLYVSNFNGGFGSEWLYAAKKRYEDARKDEVYVDDKGAQKRGVQIMISGSKEQIMSLGNQILNNQEEVYFTEYAYYYQLKAKGYLLDLTEAVTSKNSDGKTIESKLTEEQIYYYKDNGKYYGIPHYSGFSGLIYDVDLFESRGYYIKDGYTYNGNKNTLPNCFTKTMGKSAGPNGVKGDADDGLPANYEEFYMLCDRIDADGRVPIMWNGATANDYLTYFLNALVAQNEGLEQMMLNFNYLSETQAKTLGKIVDGQFVLDASPTEITSKNGYELARQRGKYEALKLLRRVVTTEGYHASDPFGGTSHLQAQKKFLSNGIVNDEDRAAMLVEGIWWENEADGAFDEVVNRAGEEYSRTNRRFGLMPLPSFDGSNKTSTLIDHIYSLCFIKSNVAEHKKALAMDFVKFCNTDESLKEYTKITNTPKALAYAMTETDMNGMSPFGKALINLKQISDVVYPYSQDAFYVNNQSVFQGNKMYNATVGSTSYTRTGATFYEKGISAEDFFGGMYKYYSTAWSGYVH